MPPQYEMTDGESNFITPLKKIVRWSVPGDINKKLRGFIVEKIFQGKGTSQKTLMINEPEYFDGDTFYEVRENDFTSYFSKRKDKSNSALDIDVFMIARHNDPTSFFYHKSQQTPLPSPSRMHVELVRLDWLKPHEQLVSESRVNALIKATLSWDAYVRPLLVDIKTGGILDGHHRYEVAKRLGLKRVPAVLVDYLADDSIQVTVWEGCGRSDLTKEDVINMCLSDNLFPPKTSKHTFVDNIPPILVPLDQLRRHASDIH